MSIFLEINGQKHTPLEAVRLGQKFYHGGDKQQALFIFNSVLKVAPGHAEANISAGFCHLDAGHWKDALACATAARQTDKSLLKTYHLAVGAMRDNLPVQKTKTWCENGLAEHPNDHTLLLQRAIIHSDADEHDGVLACLKPILAADTGFTNPAMAFSLLSNNTPVAEWDGLFRSLPLASGHPVLALSRDTQRVISLWMQGRHADADTLFKDILVRRAALIADNNLGSRDPVELHTLKTTLQNLIGYTNMFERLMPLPPPAAPAGLPALAMVGDSHVVPQNGHVVTWRGQDHVIASNLAVGIKLWHLASPDNHMRLRRMVRDIVRGLPDGMPVFVSIGEIDARSQEGIFPLMAKTGKPAEQLVEETCAPAFAWLKEQLGERPVIIGGIPAPVMHRDARYFPNDPTKHEDYARCVRALNQRMATESARYGWDFADLHALTAGDDGLFSNGTWHLEDTHLKPGALAAVLAEMK